MLTSVRTLSENGPLRVEIARWRNRLVIVKRLRGDSEVLEDRLAREARVIRRLRHKNIIPLLATEGTSLIYPYNKGVSLADVLQQGILSPQRAATIMLDILSALVYIHNQGVIHLDVKPANIIVQGKRALLTDFGFAKDLALAAITQPGTFFGTPNYMPPEQFRGQRNDPRSDIYGAGAVLYHMLVGEPPYGNQVIRFLLGDPTVNKTPLPACAAPLLEVVDKALQSLPENRFQTAQDMYQAVSRARDLCTS
ncbi:MAG: serine/threonine-protein kinase [Deinococcota bacterium]